MASPPPRPAPEPTTPAPRRRTFGNWLLLAVEVGAVLGLAVTWINSLGVLRTLNAEAATVNTLPTLTPTALITPIFLPSGHTPPTSAGGAQPYEASLPENVRFMVTPLPPILLPTPGPAQPQRMIIEAINVDAPVVQGVDWEQLKKGIGQVIGTALPGQVGNGVHSAHNDIYGEIFRDLDQLKPGNEILIYTASREYRYVVREWRIVEPTEVTVMEPTMIATLTLISCYPYLVDTQRIVVFGDLVTEG